MFKTTGLAFAGPCEYHTRGIRYSCVYDNMVITTYDKLHLESIGPTARKLSHQHWPLPWK